MSEKESFPGLVGAFGLVVAMWFGQILVIRPIQALGGADGSTLLLAAMVSNGVVGAGYLALRQLRFRDVLHPSRSSLRATLGLVVPPVLLLVPAIFVIASFADDLVSVPFPMSAAEQARFQEILSTQLNSLLAIVIAGPIFEELLFRGIILRGLLARMAPGRAIAASALIFGIAHLDIHQVVPAALIGWPLGWLYVRFRSIVPGIFLHAAFNALSVVAAATVGQDATTSDLPAWFLLGSVAAFVAGAPILLALSRLRQSGA
jgi:membrane protease YdiL (CAAX protease family)